MEEWWGVVEGADEGREVEEGRVCCEEGAPWEWEVEVEGLDIGLGDLEGWRGGYGVLVVERFVGGWVLWCLLWWLQGES